MRATGQELEDDDSMTPSSDLENMRHAFTAEIRTALGHIVTRLDGLEAKMAAGSQSSGSAASAQGVASSPMRADLPPPNFGPSAVRPAVAAASSPAAASERDDASVRSGESTIFGDHAPLSACIGSPDESKAHDPDSRHLSKLWFDLLASGKFKDDKAQVNIVTGAARAMLATLAFLDELEESLPRERQAALEQLRQGLALSCSDCSQHLSTFQVRAAGYNDDWANILRDAARARLSEAQFQGLTVGGIPIACPYSADLIQGTLQRKLELNVRDLAATPASGSKSRATSDADTLEHERKLKAVEEKLKEAKAEASAAKSRLGRAKTLLDEHNVEFDVSKVLPQRAGKTKGKPAKDSKPVKTKTKASPAADEAAGGTE